MKTAEVEISLRYMVRCLGILVTKLVNIFGGNCEVIQSDTILDSDLKKDHILISYHYIREDIAVKIVNTC